MRNACDSGTCATVLLDGNNGYDSGKFSTVLTAGKGLSQLQRDILMIAYRNISAHAVVDGRESAGPPQYQLGVRVNGNFGNRFMHAYYHEVLVDHFGWMPWDDYRWRSNKRSPGHWKFSREQIGHKKYASAQASLSRAITRLEDRGLVGVFCGVRSRWSGIELTEHGARVARELIETCDS
jgi:hypothetical protein